MNGQAFGGFANGLMGGLSLGMAVKNFKAGMPNNKPDMGAPASGSTAAGYSGDLSGFSPRAEGSLGLDAAKPVQQESSNWGVLGKIAGMLGAGKEQTTMNGGANQTQTKPTQPTVGLQGGINQ